MQLGVAVCYASEPEATMEGIAKVVTFLVQSRGVGN